MKHGLAFTDHIRTEKVPKRSKKTSSLKPRNNLLALLLFFIGILLLGRLFFVQVVQGEYYRLLSDSNRIRTQVLHAPRGVIFDRSGTPLVFNTPGFRQIIGQRTVLLSKEDALSKIAKGEKNIEVDSLRQYPYKEAFAHVLGYVGQISQEQLKEDSHKNYLVTDIVGKSGIESQYEKTLKGIDGRQLYEVDAMGREVRKLGQTDPISGQDITLTIDQPLQQKAYDAMKDVKRGGGYRL